MLADFVHFEFKEDLVVTSIFRTQAEHDALYALTPPDKRPKTSPHMYWNAFDIRSTVFSDAEKQRMLKFLNCFTYLTGQGKPVAILHSIAGNVEHFHVQAN